MYKDKPIKFVIKLYADHDTLWVKHATHQKCESLRTASSSNLDNMVNNSTNFNTKYAEFSTKGLVLFHFHSPFSGYNQRCNLYQQTVPFLQSISTSLFHPYLFIKSSLQSPLILLSYITQEFFTSFFLRKIIPTIYNKNIFPIWNILPIQAASRYQEIMEYCEDWQCLISPFFLKVWTVIATLTYNHWFFITQTQKIDTLQVWQTIKSSFSHTLNLFSLPPYSTNTTTRTHIPLETSCLIWFSF